MPGTRSDRLAPVRKSITVPWEPAAAFRRFTEGIGAWWPLASHSVSQSAEATVRVEGRAGGRICETAPDGIEHVWGTVTEWDPPRGIAFTWHPGRPADTGQEVAVTFQPERGGTRVDLVHSGWERLGESGAAMRTGYQTGWDHVLGRYAG
jgi:uncharacterized protein YndB with AHSA1/START domain